MLPKFMLNYLYRISRKRTPWILLVLSALFLEASALFFQYVMQLEPCVLCVYERTAVMGILLAGIVAVLAPGVALLRWLGLLLWTASAVWGLLLAIRHTGVQLFPDQNSCEYLANYPDWFKLDVWLPAMFQPTGFCEEIQWQFFGYSMPQTMIGICALYLLVVLLVLLAQIWGRDTRSIYR